MFGIPGFKAAPNKIISYACYLLVLNSQLDKLEISKWLG